MTPSATLDEPRAPVRAAERELPAVRKLEEALIRGPEAKLVGPAGEIAIPRTVYQVLRRVVHEMIRGNAVAVVPVHMELTTQQAADLINVSRPYLIRLLDEKRIPFRRQGTHRRIRFDDLMAYRRERSRRRGEALAEMTREAQDEGRYD